jgi:hypothetical protein
MRDCHKYCLLLRREMTRWLEQSIWMDGPGPHGGGEDEANYALAWFPHYLVTGDERILKHFRGLLADLARWVDAECFHGYPPDAEVHHGPEPFLLFLPRYLGLVPEDDMARRLLEDAAHHIGNWVEDVPPWYDYEGDRFRSYYLGTRLVREDARYAYEVAEHLRFIHIALAAYRVLKEERYLEWALRYGRRRARLIVEAGDDPIPVLWDLNGKGFRESDLTTREQRAMACSGHHVTGDPLAGVENLLASGAIYAFGDLFMLSGDEIFKRAALKMVEPLIGELLDPYADPGTAAVGYYRWAFQDDSLDDRIHEVLREIPPELDAELAMIFPQGRRRREPGVGRRSDMIYWGEWSDDGSVRPIREPSTAALTLAYQMTGKLEFAKRAFRSAATRLMMARRVLRGGREHADMGGAICSVAAGHGRNWGQGAVTGCYGPLLLGTREILGSVTPIIEVKDDEGKARLPEEILSLVVPPIKDDGEVFLFNGGERKLSFSWRERGAEDDSWRSVTLAPNESKRFPIVVRRWHDVSF